MSRRVWNRRGWVVAFTLALACADDAGGGGTEDGSTGRGSSDGGDETPPPDDGDTTGGGSDSDQDSTSVGTGSTSDGTSSSGIATSSGSDGSGDTGDTDGAASCAAGEKRGAAGSTDGLATSAGVAVNVRTPQDYDPTVAYPLLIVFAPAGANAVQTEGFTGLTPDALSAGYIVVYANHVSPMSVEIVGGLSPVLDDVIETWCVDDSRVFLSGHSDGGTIAEILLAVDDAEPRPRAAAPSAAGVSATTMMQVGCPAEPRPIMVMHSINDALFDPASGFGLGAAEVWASCNGCDPDPVPDGACVSWSGCTDDVATMYCEGNGVHGAWPAINAAMFAFFEAT